MEDFRILPSRYGSPEELERRCRELEALCLACLEKLPPEDRALFAEYRSLLREKEDRRVLCAYNGGIQVGRQRAGKEAGL